MGQKQYQYRVDSHAGTRRVKVITEDAGGMGRVVSRRGVGTLGRIEHVELEKESIVMGNPKPRDSEMLLFFRTMGRMLNRMESQDLAFETTALQLEDPVLLGIIGDIRRSDGTKVSAVIGKYDYVFGKTVVHQFEAGEEAGKTARVYERLAVQYREARELARKLQGAILGPLFNLLMMIVIGLYFFLKIIPQQVEMMQQREIDLPAITIALSEFSMWLQGSVMGWLSTLAAIASIVLYYRQINRQGWFEKFKIRVPYFGRFYTLVRMHGYIRQLSDMMACGVPEAKAYDIIVEIAQNREFKKYFDGVRSAVKAGKPLPEAYYTNSMLIGKPGLYLASMMRIAQETGDPIKVMEDVCDDWKAEIDFMTTVLPAVVNMVMTVAYLSFGVVMILLIWMPYLMGLQSLQTKFNKLGGID